MENKSKGWTMSDQEYESLSDEQKIDVDFILHFKKLVSVWRISCALLFFIPLIIFTIVFILALAYDWRAVYTWNDENAASAYIMAFFIILIASRLPMQWFYWKLSRKRNATVFAEICNKTPLGSSYYYQRIQPTVPRNSPLPLLIFPTAFQQYHLSYLIYIIIYPDKAPKNMDKRLIYTVYFSKFK